MAAGDSTVWLILAADAVWDVGGRTDYGRAVLVGVGVAAVQAVLSPLWLRRFRYGPLEWVWRCLTWWQPVAARRTVR